MIAPVAYGIQIRCFPSSSVASLKCCKKKARILSMTAEECQTPD
jgi:hypothetical protein